MDQNIVECSICLSSIILPVTLQCGHSYCEPCIKHTHFHHLKRVCPICRKRIDMNINDLKVNLMLDQILKNYFKGNQKYLARLIAVQKRHEVNKYVEVWEMVKRKVREMYPWIIILLLLYHLIRIKVNVFNLLFEKYKDKALKLAETIEKQNSLDFKFLLFSQFMRILFSNMIIH